MPIREIAGDKLPVDPVKEKKSNQTEKAKAPAAGSKDRVELSPEAKSLFEAEQTKKLDDIREKVDRGYYDTPEVTEKVADAILKEFKSPR